MTVCRGGALLRPRPPVCCRAMGGAEPRPYKWRPVLQNKKHHPKGQSSKRRAPRLARRLPPPTRTRPCRQSTGLSASPLRGDRAFLASSPRKKILDTQRVSSIFWSGRRGSNSLPRPWQGRALPDELRPRNGIDYSASHRCCQPRIYYFTVNLPAPFPPGRGPLPAFPPFPRSPWAPPPSAGSR